MKKTSKPKEQKSCRIALRMTLRESITLEELSEKTGKTVSALLREGLCLLLEKYGLLSDIS